MSQRVMEFEKSNSSAKASKSMRGMPCGKSKSRSLEAESAGGGVSGNRANAGESVRMYANFGAG